MTGINDAMGMGRVILFSSSFIGGGCGWDLPLCCGWLQVDVRSDGASQGCRQFESFQLNKVLVYLCGN